MATAVIQINGASGSRSDLSTGVLVNLNDAGTGAISRLWELLSVPPGSASTLATPTAQTSSFTPDIVGSYRIRLTVNGAITDIAIGAVRTANLSMRIPATGEEDNFDESGNTTGWSGSLHEAFLAIDNNVVAPAAHAPSHISGGSDEIDGDVLDIDFTPTNYVPTTSPGEVTGVDELTAHLAGVDGYIGDLGNDVEDHLADLVNPHATDIDNLGTGTLAELNVAITDATLFDRSELDGYANVDHDASHIRGGTDEIDGDILDIDFTPTHYVPTTSPGEVTNVDELTAHLAGVDGYIGDLGNDVEDHLADLVNPHTVSLDQAYDEAGAGSGRTITADTGAVVIDASGAEALELDGYLTLNSISDPTPIPLKGMLHVKQIDGYNDLHYMDEYGIGVRLTEDGYSYVKLTASDGSMWKLVVAPTGVLSTEAL